MKKIKQKVKIIDEFKKFISRGNVMDLAVGVIIGAAFGKIVSSLVDDILMPVIGMAIGGLNFTNLTIKFNDSIISYGKFIQNVLDFIIVAFCIFIIVKFVNKLFHKEEPASKPIPPKSEEVKLLEEIRDLLKKTK